MYSDFYHAPIEFDYEILEFCESHFNCENIQINHIRRPVQKKHEKAEPQFGRGSPKAGGLVPPVDQINHRRKGCAAEFELASIHAFEDVGLGVVVVKIALRINAQA